MEPGDLIQWHGQVWLVRKVDRELVTAVVESTDRRTEVLPSDADTTGACGIWCSPAREWPSAPLPLCSFTRLGHVWRSTTELTRLLDWVKLDDFQIGGALYLHPDLQLGYGDRLTVTYLGSRNRRTHRSVEIPRNFRSLADKTAAAAALVREPAPVLPKVTPTFFKLLKGDE